MMQVTTSNERLSRCDTADRRPDTSVLVDFRDPLGFSATSPATSTRGSGEMRRVTSQLSVDGELISIPPATTLA
jgi:hypothetical protein